MFTEAKLGEMSLKVRLLLSYSNSILEDSQIFGLFRSSISTLLFYISIQESETELVASSLYLIDMIADDFPNLLQEVQEEIISTVKQLLRKRGSSYCCRAGTTILQALSRAGFNYSILENSHMIESLCYKIFDPQAEQQDVIYSCISIIWRSVDDLGRKNWILDKVRKLGGVHLWESIIQASDDYDYHLINNIEDLYPNAGFEIPKIGLEYKAFWDLNIKFVCS